MFYYVQNVLFHTILYILVPPSCFPGFLIGVTGYLLALVTYFQTFSILFLGRWYVEPGIHFLLHTFIPISKCLVERVQRRGYGGYRGE